MCVEAREKPQLAVVLLGPVHPIFWARLLLGPKLTQKPQLPKDQVTPWMLGIVVAGNNEASKQGGLWVLSI